MYNRILRSAAVIAGTVAPVPVVTSTRRPAQAATNTADRKNTNPQKVFRTICVFTLIPPWGLS